MDYRHLEPRNIFGCVESVRRTVGRTKAGCNAKCVVELTVHGFVKSVLLHATAIVRTFTSVCVFLHKLLSTLHGIEEISVLCSGGGGAAAFVHRALTTK